MFLYHFYDARSGPFRSITSISQDEARDIIERIKIERPNSQLRANASRGICKKGRDHGDSFSSLYGFRI